MTGPLDGTGPDGTGPDDTAPEDGTGPDYLDGNAAAGPLSEFFAIDVVSSRGRCHGCGRTDALATARLYPGSHGLLLRCPGCAEVLLRLVDTGDTVRLDLRGLSFVELRRT